jgi:hypothetical protein
MKEKRINALKKVREEVEKINKKEGK